MNKMTVYILQDDDGDEPVVFQTEELAIESAQKLMIAQAETPENWNDRFSLFATDFHFNG